jgi:hypothetical protein
MHPGVTPSAVHGKEGVVGSSPTPGFLCSGSSSRGPPPEVNIWGT